MTNKKVKSIFFAILAAAFYAVNVPFSKQLLQNVPPTFMASFLYFGAGIGVGVMYFFHWDNEKPLYFLFYSSNPVKNPENQRSRKAFSCHLCGGQASFLPF